MTMNKECTTNNLSQKAKKKQKTPHLLPGKDLLFSFFFPFMAPTTTGFCFFVLFFFSYDVASAVSADEFPLAELERAAALVEARDYEAAVAAFERAVPAAILAEGRCDGSDGERRAQAKALLNYRMTYVRALRRAGLYDRGLAEAAALAAAARGMASATSRDFVLANILSEDAAIYACTEVTDGTRPPSFLFSSFQLSFRSSRKWKRRCARRSSRSI
jgi:hypothetical protein